MPYAALVELEEKLAKNYREMSSKAVQSNIRYFLDLFGRSHQTIAHRLMAYESGEVESESVSYDTPAAIWATQHLNLEDEIDLNSLQSVLLYIAKTEDSSLSEYDRILSDSKCKGRGNSLIRLREEKAVITTKADRLYHDMIESKIS